MTASVTQTWLEGALQSIREPIALTGGTGFVGSHLVDVLCGAGRRPRVLVRDPSSPRWIAESEVEWVAGSLEDGDALIRLVAGAGTVIHLAGVVRAGRPDDFDTGNRQGTSRLLRAVRDAAPEARVVHVSSLAGAGPSPSPEGVSPDDPPRPISAYGRSKLAAEAEVAALGDDRQWTIVRPPAIYGPRDTDVLEFFKMASRGLVAIPGGERWITVAHVTDVNLAILAAAARGEHGRIYHVGDPTPYRLDELLTIVVSAGGVDARIVHVPAPVLRVAGWFGSLGQRLGMRRIALTADKAEELLARHWTARTGPCREALGVPTGIGFARGAAETWAWYRSMGWLK